MSNEFYDNRFLDKLCELFLSSSFNPTACDKLIKEMNVFVDAPGFLREANHYIILNLSAHIGCRGGPHGTCSTNEVDYNWYLKYFIFMSKLFLSHSKYININPNACIQLVKFIICHPCDKIGDENKLSFLDNLLANKAFRKVVFKEDSELTIKLNKNQLDELSNSYYLGGYRNIKTGEETYKCPKDICELLKSKYAEYNSELYQAIGMAKVSRFFGTPVLEIGNNISSLNQSPPDNNNKLC